MLTTDNIVKAQDYGLWIMEMKTLNLSRDYFLLNLSLWNDKNKKHLALVIAFAELRQC